MSIKAVVPTESESSYGLETAGAHANLGTHIQ